MEHDDSFHNLQQTAYKILARKSASSAQQIVGALTAFITSAEPDCFDSHMPALRRHLERLLVSEFDQATPMACATRVAELIVAARHRSIDELLTAGA